MAYAKAKQEEFEALMERADNLFDIEKFNKMLVQKKIYKYKFEDLVYAYINYAPDYDPKLFNNLTEDEWASFAEVIDFSECDTIYKYKELMNKMLKNFPNLRSESLEEVYNLMSAELERINTESPMMSHGHPVRIPYLNWTPLYGGILCPSLKFGVKYRKWAIANQLNYVKQPNTPVMSMNQEARYAAGYDAIGQENPLRNESEIDPSNL